MFFKTPTEYVVIDTETTGISPQFNRVIEVGALRIKNNTIVERFEAIVRSVPHVPHFIASFTGITTQLLRAEGRRPEEVYWELSKFIGDSPLLGHNIRFDHGFINAEFTRYAVPLWYGELICTLKLSRQLMPELPSHRLEALKEYWQVRAPSHRALADAHTTWQIYQSLVGLAEQEKAKLRKHLREI